ncbi:hypothetical protein [Devosia sp. FKR38]|uniref:hypothetical protein n=1 Tax=Devosia sp. FKR38 TaxID=2562312 RepID=UPI0010BFC012|nr:hypothetical protein [Devosia sp. FKR38]
MAQSNAFRFRSLVLLATLPALLVGGALWALSAVVPACVVDEHARLTSPDARYDLLVFSRACGGDTSPNTQAALIPSGDSLPDDAASFLVIAQAVGLDASWTDASAIAITIAPGADIRRQDAEVAGVAVTYR